jgi:hypothetical protein
MPMISPVHFYCVGQSSSVVRKIAFSTTPLVKKLFGNFIHLIRVAMLALLLCSALQCKVLGIVGQ